MKNNKGISIVTVVLTIIVIIILASIGISASLVTVDNTTKATFLEALKLADQSVKTYNIDAVLKQQVDDYDPDNLQWDGESEYLENSARIQDKDQEDTVSFLLNDRYTRELAGKIYIKDGKIYVKDEYLTEKVWAAEIFSYLSGDQG